jgi:hypothetical protein
MQINPVQPESALQKYINNESIQTRVTSVTQQLSRSTILAEWEEDQKRCDVHVGCNQIQIEESAIVHFNQRLEMDPPTNSFSLFKAKKKGRNIISRKLKNKLIVNLLELSHGFIQVMAV